MEKQYSTNTPQYQFNDLSAGFNTLQNDGSKSRYLFRLDQVLIFRTGIQTHHDMLFIKPIFDGHQFIEQWNIDMEDEDRVLRIVSGHLKHSDVIELVTWCGFFCDELV